MELCSNGLFMKFVILILYLQNVWTNIICMQMSTFSNMGLGQYSIRVYLCRSVWSYAQERVSFSATVSGTYISYNCIVSPSTAMSNNPKHNKVIIWQCRK